MASKRSRLPSALPLPYVPALDRSRNERAFLSHEAVFSDSDDFAHASETVVWESFGVQRRYFAENVRLVPEESVLRVEYAHGWYQGAPARSEAPRQVMKLALGEWGQVVHNGRFGGYSDWSYRQVTLNAGLLDVDDLRPFSGKPDQRFEDLAHLL